MKKLAFALLAAAGLFWSCSTELDLLDDWKETTIVYGLLDQSKPKQYIRIQKAFLGPDNALAMAQNYDSAYYVNQMNVRIEELQNGNVVNTYTLNPDSVYNKQPGDFSSPFQVLYSMNTPVMNTTRTYRLVISNPSTGNTVSSTAMLINDFNISRPTGPSIGIIKLTPTTVVKVEWNGTANARIYEVGMRFFYTEFYTNGDSAQLQAPEWLVERVIPASNDLTTVKSIDMDPNGFHRFLSQNITTGSNVLARRARYVEFVIYAGGEELKTYIDVNGPSNSVVQEKPIYTNIENGVGLFSARYSKAKTNLTLSPQSLDTLAGGQFTCGMRFYNRNGQLVPCQ